MAIEIVFKNDSCEWIDCEAPTPEDLEYLHSRYNINNLLLDDTTDKNHLPTFEQDRDVKFFLTRENTELERLNLNTISDISTKLGIFILDNVVITVHRLKNRSIYEYKKEIYGETEGDITPDSIALRLALKVIKSFDDEGNHLSDAVDDAENQIFLNY